MDRVETVFPHVLQSILEYLEPRDLANCRLVNKAWNAETAPILEQKLTIQLSSFQNLSSYCETFERSIETISLRFQSFHFGTNLFCLEKCPKRFRYTGFGPGQEERLCRLTEAFQRFAEVSGDNVLKIVVLVNPSLGVGLVGINSHPFMPFVFRNLSKMIYDNFPKLESFVLNVEADYELPTDPDFVDFEPDLSMEVFVENFPSRELPNLKEITLKSLYGVPVERSKVMFSTFIQNLFSSAINLDKLTSWSWWDTEGFLDSFSSLSSNLRCLTITETLRDSDLSAITAHNFAILKVVDLTIGDDVTRASLQEFLHRYRLFLQKLYLRLESRNWNEPHVQLCPQLPPPETVMKELDLLYLGRYYNSTLIWRNLPKLQKLVLHCCRNLTHIGSNSFHMPRTLTFSGTPTTALNTLDVTESRSLGVSETETETFSFIEPFKFSFLTSLSIGSVASPPLSIIFENSKLLRHLRISGCQSVNARTICGIPSSLLETISPVGNLQKDSSPDVVEAMMRMAKAVDREGPYIGDLIGLQSLTLNADLSDSSVLFGVVQCEQLRRLSLSSFPQEFSWRAKLILEHGLKHLETMNIRIPE